MRGLSLLIGGFIASGLMIAACGSDSSNTTPSGTAGSGGSGSNCVGLYTGMTSSQFTAAVTAGLACGNGSDENLICSNDVTTDVGSCGQQCYLAHAGDEAGIKSCTADCVNGMLPSAI